MPLRAGPPRIFSVKPDSGYVKLWCLLCETIAEPSHCRGRKHLKELRGKYAEDAKIFVKWPSRFNWQGEE
eukprot:9213110-Lingulodinium_polyedra.AAC.1